ncbi:hypothetical protein VKT23_013118 [Stygiomarasmius scandens]|uniref:Uncharacterized protein n=1 Tax=Marasmiellus scandens TaxID=2682957 RepID=A0ABR1J487_9AGAR
MRTQSNAKEILIGAEEALERLHRAVLEDEDDDVPDGEARKRVLPLVDQILRLLRLLQAISRISFRKKSSADMIRPLMIQLQTTISDAANRFDRDSGRASIRASAELVSIILDWTLSKEGVSADETKACKDILVTFLAIVVPSLCNTIKSSLSARAFSVCFPRLAMREVMDPTWEAGDQAMQAAVSAYVKIHSVGGSMDSFPSIPSPPNQVALIIYAHWLIQSTLQNLMPSVSTTLSNLEAVFPVVISSIQTSHFLEETLAILLLSLHNLQQPGKSVIELPPDLIHPLFTLLPHLASAHPEPQVRHHTFRVLSMVLRSTPAMVRMHALRSLTGPSDPDQRPGRGSNPDVEDVEEARRLQMQIAAVGLVKEAVLEALSSTPTLSSSRNVFATPKFLQTFGPVLFATQPQNYFETLVQRIQGLPRTAEDYWDQLRKELEKEAELTRLVECMSLYYVLLLRDVQNWTGIRDRDNVANVGRSLLIPTKRALDALLQNDQEAEAHHRHAQLHAVMPLVALKLGLERVDDALKDLGLATRDG